MSAGVKWRRGKQRQDRGQDAGAGGGEAAESSSWASKPGWCPLWDDRGQLSAQAAPRPMRATYAKHRQSFTIFPKLKSKCRASLVVQWLKTCLVMKGTPVRPLAREDATHLGATNLAYTTTAACVPSSPCSTREAHTPQPESSAWSPYWRKPMCSNQDPEDPAQPKIRLNK